MEIGKITRSWQRSKQEDLKLSSQPSRNSALELFISAEKVSIGLEKIHPWKPFSSSYRQKLPSAHSRGICSSGFAQGASSLWNSSLVVRSSFLEWPDLHWKRQSIQAALIYLYGGPDRISFACHIASQ